MDKIQTLFAELKDLLAMDCIQSKRQLYFPLEKSSLTDEESFVVSQCEEMYHQLIFFILYSDNTEGAGGPKGYGCPPNMPGKAFSGSVESGS